MTNIVIDGHVHVYPFHDYALALSSLFRGLDAIAETGLGPKAQYVRVALLAERRDCRFFSELERRISGYEIKEKSSDFATVADPSSGKLIYILPGRQIVSSERIEILALTKDADIPDGLPAHEIIELAKKQSAAPVLSWAPGKWFFRRHKVVNELLTTSEPGSFLIGDTSLRPTIWPVPALMQKAADLGFRVIAGSDPLPAFSEERMAGTYGFILKADFNDGNPGESVRTALFDPSITSELAGRRCSPSVVFQRMRRHRQSVAGDRKNA